MTEMEKVKSMIQEAGAGNAWIGLKQGSSPKWQWSLAGRDFYRENESDFRNWDSGQPGEGVAEECVIMIANGQWHDVGCSSSFPFICYDGGSSTHPYVLVTEYKNWTDAQRYCREKHTDLASVRNQTENDQIKDVRGNEGIAWIGLFRDAWEWSDGSSSSFRHWNTGQPDNGGVACTEIKNGQWNDAGCHHQINFTCYEGHGLKEPPLLTRWVGLLHSYGVGWYWVCGQTVCYRNWTQGHEQEDSFQQRVGAVESGGGLWVSNLTKTDKLNFICTTKVAAIGPDAGGGRSEVLGEHRHNRAG
ncbi:C-type mannose receptor 2-like [Alosa alosa]|uniref:C-type mannose receptor 2-like n=1 Tax=Alosa alosa TaxID=278164 RepID=UPI0020153054|nr:C-type mannose receptor 2-like [Alosa alosa]